MESIEFGQLKHHFGHYGDELRFDGYGDPHDLDPEGIGPVAAEGDGEDQEERDFLDDTFEEWAKPGGEEEAAAAAALAFFNDIKSDCMWGSSLFGGGRKRDLSLTLTDLYDSHAAAEGQDHGLGDLLGTTPPDMESQIFFGGCNGLMENSQAEEDEPEAKRKERFGPNWSQSRACRVCIVLP